MGQALTPAVSRIPAMEGARYAEIEATRVLRDRFANMLRFPVLARECQADAQAALQHLHAANVQRFGWRDAEVIRAEAFAEAVETTVPQPEVIESDFGDLDGELQP